ncbi:MAG: transposase [Hyphomonadaceae bacterium]
MPRRTYSPDEVLTKLKRAESLVAAGATLNEAAKLVGVTYGTLVEWRAKFDVLASAGIKRIKQLEAENARLRRAIAELDEQLSAGGQQPLPPPDKPARKSAAKRKPER